MRAGGKWFRELAASGAVLALVLAVSPAGQSASLPQLDDDRHLGVATCAGSTCHGAAEAREASNVLQNEYLTWHRRDRHAEAYEILLGERSRRIADRLRMGPPEEADACLDCHADNVPPAQRGERFQISDGVGCEACHGGAEGWIRTHANAETSHRENVANGLYPTEEPAARTRLCMSCHYSHPQSPMTHRLMAAGHPPLLFDLDTFTQIQPTHHKVDADYRRRKGVPSAARVWAVGEATGAAILLETVGQGLDTPGLFPELYYFDCSDCHHDLGGGDWVRNPDNGLPPGAVRIDDASLRLLGHIADELDPAMGQDWSQGLAGLHGATVGAGDPAAAAMRLGSLAEAVRKRLGREGIGARHGRGIVRRIVNAGIGSGYADRTWAEQATMALGSLLTTSANERWFDKQRQKRLEGALDGLYQALEEPRDYAPWRFRDALRRFTPILG